MAKELIPPSRCSARPLDGGPHTYPWLDALAQKIREGGRIASVGVVVATGVNASGAREILGFDLHTSEDGAGWTAFLRGLVAKGLSGVRLVVSDAHPGVTEELTNLKQQPGKDIAITGSATLVQSLLRDGLLDELSLLLYPIVVGTGKRLFEDVGDQVALKLVDSKTFTTGVLSLTYEPTGR